MRSGHAERVPDERAAPTASATIRPAVPEDADAVARLLATVRGESIPDLPLAAQSEDAVAPFVRRVLLDQFEVWVAEVDGDPVGFMALMPPDHIAHLYISAAHRGEGLGARFVDLARRRYPEGLQLWTFQENEDAQRFYAQQGFVPVEWADDRDEDRASPDLRMAWRPKSGRTYTWARDSTAATISSMASETGMPFFCEPSRYRNDTAPALRSSSPAMSTNGTLDFEALRIFLGNRSSLSSISTRIPLRRNRSATSCRWPENSSATGMPRTWTGESQGGNAPA